MPKPPIIINIIPAAPHKQVLTSPCNGCGVCCLLEPCPLGILLSGYRQGACQALRWDEHTQQYRCAAITAPQEVLHDRLPQILHRLVPALTWLLGQGAQRWVAAGVGCDCDVQIDKTASATAPERSA